MNTEITVGPRDLLHIIEGRAREISLYAGNPTQNFNPFELRKAIAGLYAVADNLANMVEEANAKQPPSQDAN